ncbi:MAG TPA: amidohydrolase family protein [Methylomirabilota bacterium]|nr:amidohydrolase family protein [Methylomirabilota bacterium]
MSVILFRNAKLLDPTRSELTDEASVLVEGDRIREVSSRPLAASSATVIDCGGRTLMPGLIDCHVHVFLSEVNIRYLEAVPLTLMTARAAPLMRAMLDRGFTTVRDTGGADWGIREAVALGHLAGPRLFVGGRAIGQTSGHSDARRRTDVGASCHTCNAMAFTLAIADGVTEVRRTVREQLRQGADHIKIMVSGGVASPYDPLDSLQYTVDEIRAAVEEAATFKKYVCAHAYPAEAVARAVECGVRVIEHGNLIDAPTATLMAARGAFLVPTLVAYDAINRHGRQFGMGAESLEKNKVVLEAGLRSLELARAAGVRMAYGSDLLGQLQPDQSRELLLRAEVLSPREILHSATVIGAELLGRAGELGVVAAGALADLLVVEGDPLQDLKLFQDQGAHLSLIMQGGRLHKNTLTAA